MMQNSNFYSFWNFTSFTFKFYNSSKVTYLSTKASTENSIVNIITTIFEKFFILSSMKQIIF